MYTDTVSVITLILTFSIFSSPVHSRCWKEYERGVVFMLGRFWRVKGPGLVIVIPAVQTMVRVDLRIIVMDVPAQDVISRDNVSVKVNAVLYFRVVDPQKLLSRLKTTTWRPASWHKRPCVLYWGSTSWMKCWPAGISSIPIFS